MGRCQEEAEEEEDDDDDDAVEAAEAEEDERGIKFRPMSPSSGNGREGADYSHRTNYSKTQYWIKGRVERVCAGARTGSVWAVASNFSGLQYFVPAVHICERLKGQNGVPGCLRFCVHTRTSSSTSLLSLTPSSTPRHLLWSRDRLLVMDLHNHTFSYSLEHSNLGVSSQSTVSIALQEVQLEAHQANKDNEEDGGADREEEDYDDGYRLADGFATLVSFSFSFLPSFAQVCKPCHHILQDFTHLGNSFLNGLASYFEGSLLGRRPPTKIFQRLVDGG